MNTRLGYMIAWLLVSVPAWAQVSSGIITGSITDATGASVPAARVEVTNTDTGARRPAVTDSTGIYRVPNLPPGNYKVAVSAPGMQPQTRVGLVLSIDQILTAGFVLQPGAVQESVTVMGRAEQLVQSESSSLGQVVEEHPIRELPLNGRDFQQLIGLTTGSQPGPQGQYTAGNFHINGGRGEGNSFLVDGVDVSSSFSDPVRVNPSLESISEFKVLTNNFSAEYGRSVGGVISVRLKGGTNQFHGTVFEFLRNDALDARNFFAVTKAPYRFNQFGASAGGPIKRNKLFFFTTYQGTRIRYSGAPGFGATVPTSSTAEGLYALPDAAQRAGDFSALLPKTVIYDPAAPGVPFAGNIIPQNRFDPAAARMFSLLPLPNQTGPFNFRSALPAQYQGDGFDTRIDYNLNQSNIISGTFDFIALDGQTQAPFGPMNGNLITTDYPHDRPKRTGVNYTHTFGASAVNELILGYSRDRWFGPPTEGHQYVSDLGVSYLNTSADDRRTTGYPLFLIPGYSVFGGPAGAPFDFATNVPQFDDNFSWSRGRHMFKAGFSFRDRQFNVDQSIFPRGLLVFNALSTSNKGVGGSALASALLGYPLVGQRDLSEPWGQRNQEYGMYFQDDFKVSSRLTLNLGLRYDLFMPPTEAHGHISNFDLATKQLVLAGQSGVSASTVAANLHNFGPHVGFAYSPAGNQRTVIRGGYGIAYLPLMMAAPGTSTRLTMNPPFRNNFSQVFSFLNPTVRVSNGLPISVGDPAHPTGDIVYMPAHQPYPYMQSWNFDIQHALGQGWLLDVAYAGSRGAHLTGNVNLNQAPPGPTSPSTRSPILTSINNLTGLLDRESSIYHSLQIKAEHQFASGFYMMLGYTFSKSIDDGSYTSQASDASSVSPQDSRNWQAERAVSDFDVPHRFVGSYIYELPVGKGKFLNIDNAVLDGFLGGWQINGITTIQSGGPFTATVANPRTNAGPGGAVRPDRIANGELASNVRTIQHWFDPSAFMVQGANGTNPYHFGNSGRNILRGPGLTDFDFSIFKYFPLTERLKMQLRGELFNVFNTPNFNLPVAAVDTPQAGIITAAHDPREIQIALKLIF